MKKWAENFKQKFKEYWRRIYHYTGTKLSKGSQQIARMISSAHNDNWRRPRK